MIIHGLRVQNVCRNMRVDTVRVECRISDTERYERYSRLLNLKNLTFRIHYTNTKTVLIDCDRCICFVVFAQIFRCRH